MAVQQDRRAALKRLKLLVYAPKLNVDSFRSRMEEGFAVPFCPITSTAPITITEAFPVTSFRPKYILRGASSSIFTAAPLSQALALRGEVFARALRQNLSAASSCPNSASRPLILIRLRSKTCRRCSVRCTRNCRWPVRSTLLRKKLPLIPRSSSLPTARALPSLVRSCSVSAKNTSRAFPVSSFFLRGSIYPKRMPLQRVKKLRTN